MHSASMQENAVFVLCIERNVIRDQALLLIESIRAFAGKLRDLEIFAVAPRPKLGIDKDTRVKLDALDVTYCEAPINTYCPEYGSANRVYAAAWVAQRTSATTLIVLDSDTLFLDEPELLGPCCDVAVRPVDSKGMASIGPEDEFDPYWAALCQLAEMPIDQLPFLETTVDRLRVRSSYNGGYSVVRRDTGIMQRAAEILTCSISADLRPHKGRPDFRVFASTGLVSSLASEYWGSSQAAFSIAVWSSTRRVRMLDARYNVPLHALVQPQNWRPEWIDQAPVHVHYHWMFDPEHRAEALGLLRRLGVPADRLDWVVAHLPASYRSGFDQTTVDDPVRAISLVTPQFTGTKESEALREGSLALQEGGMVAHDGPRSVEHMQFSEQESLERRLAAAEIRCRQLEELQAHSRTVGTELNTQCNLLNLELQELKAQNAGLRAALSDRESACNRLERQLRAELSERIAERAELKGRINSIQGSICWRLTGPIRWLHKQVQFRPGIKPEGKLPQVIPGG
jgi:hypothetical protein